MNRMDRKPHSRRSLLWGTLSAWLGGTVASRSVAQPLLTNSPDLSGHTASKGSISGRDYVSVGLAGEGPEGSDDIAAILSAALKARTGLRDEIGRTLAGEIRLQPGRYRISAPLDLAPMAGLVGLTLTGSGAGTEIVFEGAAATIRCSSSRGITFRDLTFRSAQGVDAGQVAFTIDQHGNPLRSWKFERCDMVGFDRCFAVTGSAMTSEFYFDKCQFLQCYHLMDNENEQAVNWNFVNCNWENVELSTRKDPRLASAFWLKRGTFVKWTGGSMVFRGRLVLYKLTAPGSVQRPAHMIAFDGVRIELDDAIAPVPFVDRVDAGYASGTNQPTTTFANCTILQRGTARSVVYARAWANCSLSFVNCKAKGGRVVGVLDGVSPTQAASVRLENTRSISYEEDIRARLNSHDQHQVQINPDASGGAQEPMIDQRLCSLTTPATMNPKYMYFRDPTGSLPLGGTTVNLTLMPDHTMFVRIFVQRFHTAGQRLAVELRDVADRKTYASCVLTSGVERFAESHVGAEMGFQIPSDTALMLKFIGVPEVVKGMVGVEYL